MHIFDNLIVLNGLKSAEIVNYLSKNAILNNISPFIEKQAIMLKFANFHDWHYPFKDDWPYMILLEVLSAEHPAVRLRGRGAPKIIQMCR